MKEKKTFRFKNRHHYILMGLTLACAIACAALMLRVNVNSDMTKYLPDDSQMTTGLAIVSEEFGSAELQSAPVKLMVEGLSSTQRDSLKEVLLQVENIRGVSYRASEDDHYTLYDIQAPDSVDLKSMGKSISKMIPQENVVETNQDGATPPISVIIIAAAMILLVLFVMAQSWMDPIVFLLSAGISIVLNIGTNALLPSVSITTNYIGSILQLVLSLDFSIVLLNRYRQELSAAEQRMRECRSEVNMIRPTQCVNNAIKRAAPPVLSSAMTTILGLLMLAFMRLKIGMDMGVVLAKGVVCSLICTFTVLPSLLMLFRKALARSAKKTFVIPTDGLSRFITAHKTPLALFGIALFGVSWWYSRTTDIYFCTNGESKIAEVFPNSNPFVVIYDVADEGEVIELADSLAKLPGAGTVVSYPSLLLRQYTAPDMYDYLNGMRSSFAEFIPADATADLPMDVQSDMLTPEMLQILYYMRSGLSDTVTVTFPDMMRFVLDHCVDNPMFASYIDDDMRGQMDILRALMNPAPVTSGPSRVLVPAPADEPLREEWSAPEEQNAGKKLAQVLPASEVVQLLPDTSKLKAKQDSLALVGRKKPKYDESLLTDPTPQPAKPQVTQMALTAFVHLLSAENDADEVYYLSQLVDKTLLHTEMTINEMSDYIGSTRSQTRMVYSFCGSPVRMTPIRYVHFLVEDLFQRKSLQSFVTAQQKNTLTHIMRIMDAADGGKQMSAASLAQMISKYGVPVTEEHAMDLMNPRSEPSAPIASVSSEEVDVLTTNPVSVSSVSIPTSTQTSKPRKPRKRKVVLTKAEVMAQRFDKLLKSDKRFTAEEMAGNFISLGQQMDTTTVRQLYMYYGCLNAYDTTLTMSTEQVLVYVVDTLLNDPMVETFVDSTGKAAMLNVRGQLGEVVSRMSNDKHGVLLTLTNLPAESDETYAFTERVSQLADTHLAHPHYLVGESVMYSEMKNGFSHEMLIVTILTVVTIFLIVAISFRSIVVPTLLVMTVMTAVYVNVIFSGVVSGKMLYLAYLIVQSILMGATIDYGILFTNYYKEYRKTMPRYDACREAYRGSIRTIMTSGLIMAGAPGVMALLVDDVAISSIVGCLSIGAMVAIVLILSVLPAILVALDRWVVHGSNSVPDPKPGEETKDAAETASAQPVEDASTQSAEEANSKEETPSEASVDKPAE